MNRVLVLGGGAWGHALAIQAARTGAAVTVWARDPDRVRKLPPEIALTGDLDAAVRGSALALVAVPMQALRSVLAALPPTPPPLLLCAKGMETATLALPLEVAAACCPGTACGVLSGPNFAAEIAAGLPAAAAIAATDATLRDAAIAALATPSFRLYASDDPIGVQVGGAAKNVIAIGAGAVIGAGLGENARAALVTRGLAELSRLAVALGGRAETAAGLSGLGDLLLTATGTASRNFTHGLALGRGQAAPAVLVEGVATAPAIVARAALVGVELPICAAVAALLRGRATLGEAVAALLGRPLRQE